MKSFIFRIKDDGNSADFIDKQDKAAYKRLLKSMKMKGINKFRMTIELLDDSNKITEKQMNLFKMLVVNISDVSGNDYKTVENTLVQNLINGKNIDDLSNSDFNDFIEKIVVFANDFFNLNISFNSETNYVEIQKIK